MALNTPVKQRTMLTKKINIFENGVHVGTGRVAFEASGRMHVGDFFDFNGELLPDVEYYSTPTGEEWFEVVAMNVQ